MSKITTTEIINGLYSRSGTLGIADQIRLSDDDSSEVLSDVVSALSGQCYSQITSDRIANSAITANKISNSAVTINKIADGAVVQTKLDDDVKNRLNGVNVGDLINQSGTVVFYGELEDIFKYKYFISNSYGYFPLQLSYHGLNASSSNKCLFIYEDPYLDWGSDPVGQSIYATTHGCVVPAEVSYEEHHIIFTFPENGNKVNCGDVLVSAPIHITYNQNLFPTS